MCSSCGAFEKNEEVVEGDLGHFSFSEVAVAELTEGDGRSPPPLGTLSDILRVLVRRGSQREGVCFETFWKN